ncbi:hypothetical protein R4Z10_11530 [Niallia sp. XMNu-256]|uniref:hypothetical protein n=1 Tax=Niallia sp. XMNu-256 TaxID=3082444 RepID=UPI0030D0E051
MSLSTISLAQTVRKQFLFKLKANIDSLSSLIWVQLLAILFSFGGVSTMWSSFGAASIEIQHFTGDLVIVFTMIWSFTTAITITTKPNRLQDFTFVTNRLSSSLSNILFLLCANLLGSLTAILSGNVISLIKYLFSNTQLYYMETNGLDLIGGIALTFLYLCMFSALGYFIGSLVQLNKIFTVLIPILIIGLLFLTQSDPFLVKLYQFYVGESNFILFFLKSVLTTILLLIPAVSLMNRLEVRK